MSRVPGRTKPSCTERESYSSGRGPNPHVASRTGRARDAISRIPRPRAPAPEPSLLGGAPRSCRLDGVGGEDSPPPKGADVLGDEEDVLHPEVHVDDLAAPSARDLGLTRTDDRIANAVDLWFDLHLAKDGGYTPWARLEGAEYRRIHFRHKDRFMKHGHLCTTGNMVRSLIRFGYLGEERVQSAIRWLVSEQYPTGGWDCFGRKDATMDAWEGMSALAEIPPNRRGSGVKRAIAKGAEFFLEKRLLHEGAYFKPWWSLRYPWHYHYDVLVGLDFMTALGYGKDPRMQEALDHLESKRLPDGKWNLDSSNGNLAIESRGKPSKMITFLALRALLRAARIQVA